MFYRNVKPVFLFSIHSPDTAPALKSKAVYPVKLPAMMLSLSVKPIAHVLISVLDRDGFTPFNCLKNNYCTQFVPDPGTVEALGFTLPASLFLDLYSLIQEL